MCHSVQLFTVGHAVELYLKAAHTKLLGDMQKAMRFGHNVRQLWDACKAKDPTFLTGREIRSSVLDVDFLNPAVRSGLSRGDQMHFVQHQALYIVAKHLMNLKYLRLPWVPPRRGPAAFGWIFHDDYWIAFFGDLRKYLGHPEKHRRDIIGDLLDDVTPSAAWFLRRLSQGWSASSPSRV